MDERYDMVRSVVGKRYVYVRNYMPHKLYGQHVGYMFVTTTTQVWKRLFDEGKLNEAQSHFWKTKPPEELYDLDNDPDEVNNLAKSKDHAEVLKKMRLAHVNHLKNIIGVGFLPEGEIHERSEGTTPYEMARSGKYPFQRIMLAADMASGLSPQGDKPLIGYLKDKDSAIRYWGAMGLLMRGKQGVKAGGGELEKALKDNSPYVRVVAAEALGKYGSEKQIKMAVKTLGKTADPLENGCFPSMLAMNAIDHLDDKAKSLLSKIKSMPRTPTGVDKRFQGYVGRLVETTVRELEGAN